MAFNPAGYSVREPRPLPVVLLLDVSGSMSGTKIGALNLAVNEMVDTFVKDAAREVFITLSIITFGNRVTLHTPYTPVSKLSGGIAPLTADGMTPMGTALRMAKDMIEDKSVTPSRAYRPAVVLLSDGQPNDEWHGPLEDFIRNGRSSKCERFAVSVGRDADRNVLQMFAKDRDHLFEAENAGEISKAFKLISMSVSQRSKSKNPNEIPNAGFKFDGAPASAPPQSKRSAPDDEDEDEEPEF